MPLYDYICQKCQNKFEALVRKPEDKVECPKCQSEETERQLSKPAVSMGNPYMQPLNKI